MFFSYLDREMAWLSAIVDWIDFFTIIVQKSVGKFDEAWLTNVNFKIAINEFDVIWFHPTTYESFNI